MKNILKFLFIFVFFLGSSISWAEEIKDEIIPSSTGAVLLATVNIENPKIISQNGNTFEISFDLTNREIIQTGVKYSIKLLKETDKGQFLADDKVYPEKISLAENSRISKKISYVAPANLEGDFILVIESKNESGFPFGLTSVGKVSLTASQNSFNVLPETCYLGVDTENNSKKYNLKQGIDILPSENILLNCVLENKKKEEISINPIFETFFRTIYGEKVEHGLIESKQFILKPEEKKNISVILPKALKPQAYDVKVSFESNGVESNGVVAHYVIRGISATIQNVSLDKDYYKKNEIANISLSWTPGADNFPNTRIKENSAVFETKALISIFNKKGAVCVEKEEYNLPQISIEPRVDIPVSVIEKCKNPLVQISLVDSENNTLDEKNFSFETTTRGLNKNIIILVIILVIVLFLFLIRYLKNKRLNKTAMFSLILLGFILPFSFVKADTYTLGDTNGSFWAYVTIGIDKSEYEPNEKMIVSGNVYYSACANEPADVKLTSRTSRREGSTHSYVGSTITHIDKSIQGGDTIYYSKEETAPSLPHKGYSRQFTASITGSQPGEYLSLYEEIPFLVKGESSCLETHYNCSGGVTSISRTETDSYWEWQCPPVTSGFETKMCKEDKPDHGVCDLTMVNKSYYQGTWKYKTNYGCTVGVSGNQSANKTPSETANWTWTCTGEDGVPVQCLLHMPGLCGTSLLECKQGSAKTSAQAGSWTCKTGETGTADSCKVNIEENTKNGECGETRNTCKVGEPYDGKLINSNTEYSWKCSGLDGGTDSSCVVPSDKPYGSLSAEPDTCIVPIGENSCLIDKVTWQVNNYTDLYGARVWDGVKDIRYNKNPTSTWGRTSVPYTITDFATRGLERNIELRAYSTSSSKYTVLDKIKVRAILEENLSPATPTINGDRILTIAKTGEWVLYSTDPNNEKIR
ncbi:MAG: hypothetical protein PHT84_02510, partial [Candidatus Pacebacteria bacterium]|nr:hypothetical protein [Candidatus Paceibacterota bacterium]